MVKYRMPYTLTTLIRNKSSVHPAPLINCVALPSMNVPQTKNKLCQATKHTVSTELQQQNVMHDKRILKIAVVSGCSILFNGSLGVLKCILRHSFDYTQHLLDTYKQFKRIKILHIYLLFFLLKGRTHSTEGKS